MTRFITALPADPADALPPARWLDHFWEDSDEPWKCRACGYSLPWLQWLPSSLVERECPLLSPWPNSSAGFALTRPTCTSRSHV